MNLYISSRTGRFLPLFLLLLWSCNPNLPQQPKQEKADAASKAQTPPLFTLITPDQSGVDFQNVLSEGLNTNILMYEYFYNGGGVVAGDFNGDTLTDLYFTSNMGVNKLYLSQGGLAFMEVSEISGVTGRKGPWKTGATAVDINGDSKLDLYVSYSGAMPEEKRANQLFINLGNDDYGVPKFQEKASEYGLASSSFSNQGYFFDYDRDGDLDMAQLNHNPKSLPVLNEANTIRMMKEDDPQKGIRLFRQDEGKFKDVTPAAGIVGSSLCYGLGLGISDVNNDGWPDFYVSNDYDIPDYLYVNQQNGTFKNTLQESIRHNSQFSMGNDIADVNNDGLPDILTLDMLPEDNYRQKLLLAPDNYAKFDLQVRSGFHYQYMRNMLQLNNGNGSFSEIGQLAGISNTDWSWAALLADYDNDGWKDLYITNGYFRDYTNLDFINYMDSYVKSKGKLVRNDVMELVARMPASDVINYMYENKDGLSFANTTQNWGLSTPSNSNGAAYADLDNDGDLDLIVNNINQPAFIFRNDAENQRDHHYLQIDLKGKGLNTMGLGSRVTLKSQGKTQIQEQVIGRGYLSSVSPVMHFGLGEITNVDTVMVKWPDGSQEIITNIAADQRIILDQKNAKKVLAPSAIVNPSIFTEVSPIIKHDHKQIAVNDFDRQPLLLSELSYEGPCMVKGDLNQDGREDIFIGGAKGQAAAIYLQQASGEFVQMQVPSFETDREFVDTDAVILDANNDGHADLYVASGGYHDLNPDDPLLQDRLYLGVGQDFALSKASLPQLLSSSSCLATLDINQDGHTDIFVGSRVIPGRYPEAPENYVLVNDGNGNFSDKTEEIAPELRTLGLLTDVKWADLNQDNIEELIICGEWMPLSIWSMENGKLIDKTEAFLEKKYNGWWNTIELADLNKDGKIDIIAGNWGSNTQFSASAEEPAEMYFKDFDQNGSVDPIFCYYIQGKSFPYVTRDEMLRQLVSLRSRYTSYESYADQDLNSIFNSSELNKAGKLRADYMETTVFLSNSAGRLQSNELPVQAQFAPVRSIAVLDANQDGNPDLLLCGNNRHTKLRLGSMDANYGVLLTGDGKGDFSYVPQTHSGLDLRGDITEILNINKQLIFGVNGGSILTYKLNKISL